MHVIVEVPASRNPIRALCRYGLCHIGKGYTARVGRDAADRLVDARVRAETERVGVPGPDIALPGPGQVPQRLQAPAQAELQVRAGRVDGLGVAVAHRRRFDVALRLQGPSGVVRLLPAQTFIGPDVGVMSGSERRVVGQVAGHGAQNHGNTASPRERADSAQVPVEMPMNGCQPWIRRAYLVLREHPHALPRPAFPDGRRHRACDIAHELTDAAGPRRDAGANKHRRTRQRRENGPGAIGAHDLVMAQVHHESVRLERGAVPRDAAYDVRIDGGHGDIEHLPAGAGLALRKHHLQYTRHAVRGFGVALRRRAAQHEYAEGALRLLRRQRKMGRLPRQPGIEIRVPEMRIGENPVPIPGGIAEGESGRTPVAADTQPGLDQAENQRGHCDCRQYPQAPGFARCGHGRRNCMLFHATIQGPRGRVVAGGK